jgi:hypothetical protein
MNAIQIESEGMNHRACEQRIFELEAEFKKHEMMLEIYSKKLNEMETKQVSVFIF